MLIFELDLDSVKVNEHAECLD